MLPVLIKSFFKYLTIIACYNPTGQVILLIYNPVSEVKLTRHILD